MAKFSKEEMIKKAQKVIEQEAEAVRLAAGQLNENIAEIAELMLNCKGHILVTGAGTSRAIALRFAHLLACCGAPGLFINAADCLHGGAGAITAKDVVFVISKGGYSKEINKFVQIAKTKRAKIIGLTEDDRSPLAKMCTAIYKIKASPDVDPVRGRVGGKSSIRNVEKVSNGVDPYGMIATGSSLVNAAACDAICVVLLELKGYTKEEFGKTHPEGAVGKKLARKRK
jgi:arabinose-5-phosphate isomerase